MIIMSKIGLYNLEPNIVNTAMMQVSSYHKSIGDEVYIYIGEMGHKRWKRLDYVSKCYSINSLEEFNSDNIIKHIQNIGKRNKKNLKIVFKRDWQLISRVWFIIEPYKETSQWDLEEQIMSVKIDRYELIVKESKVVIYDNKLQMSIASIYTKVKEYNMSLAQIILDELNTGNYEEEV